MTLPAKYIEVLRQDTVIDGMVSSAAIVRGVGVKVSGNNTVATMTSATYTLGFAMVEASASGEAVPVLRKGKVRLYNSSTVIAATATFGSFNVDAPIYMTNVGLWTELLDTSNIFVGIVVDEQSDYVDIEVDVSIKTVAKT